MINQFSQACLAKKFMIPNSPTLLLAAVCFCEVLHLRVSEDQMKVPVAQVAPRRGLLLVLIMDRAVGPLDPSHGKIYQAPGISGCEPRGPDAIRIGWAMLGCYLTIHPQKSTNQSQSVT